MIPQFLEDHFGAILIAAIAMGVTGGIWLLFAIYETDISLARTAVFLLPILTYKIVALNPRQCLAPFVLQILGAILLAAGIYGCWMHMAHDAHPPLFHGQA